MISFGARQIPTPIEGSQNVDSNISHIIFGSKIIFDCDHHALKAKKRVNVVSTTTPSLKCIPIFRSFVNVAKHIHHAELWAIPRVDFCQ